MIATPLKEVVVVQGVQTTGVPSVQANSLVRLVAAAASVSLVAASGVLLIEAQGQTRPLFQIPATLATLGLGAATLHVGSLAVRGRRRAALTVWGSCLALLLLMPLLQFLPIRYDNVALLDLIALAPPLWPYSVAIPLLLFLLLETSLPSLRSSNSTSLLFLLLGLLSATMLLFFSTALMGSLVNHSTLILVPHRLFLGVLAPIGLSSLIVVATVLPRKGLVLEGMALLVVTGLGVEWMSTWSYRGPHFLREAAQVPYPGFPLLPILAGTIPGALATLVGVLAGWEAYARGKREYPPEPVLGKESLG